MENQNVERFRRMFNVELPQSDSMDDYLDFILTKIRPVSEDLYEDEYWLNHRWLEIRDDVKFHESVLHIFTGENEYLISVDGNISKGVWRTLESPNTMILEHGSGNELYDLAFLNEQFFVLKKHGDQERKGQAKYFVMGREHVVRGLEWRDCMELMFNVYRNNSRWTWAVGLIMVLIALIILLSVV